MKNRPFSLLIKPASYLCNLQCDYCFYLCKENLYQDKANLKMKDDVAEHMMKMYMESEQAQYNICWQGGEPALMGLAFYQKAVNYQMKYAKKGARIANALQTNATLLDAQWAKFLKAYQFLVGVSLDGPFAMHDKFRQNMQKEGSHKAVIAGLNHLKQERVACNILTLVNSYNVHHPKEVYTYLKKQGVSYLQFTPCVEFDQAQKRKPYAITGEQWGSFLCAIFDMWLQEDVGKIAIRHFEAIIEQMVYGTCSICTMGTTCNQYLVIEHNGDVYPCDFFVEEKRKLGNIMINSWEELFTQKAFIEFGQYKQKWHVTCAMCPYVAYCHGDCLKNRFYCSEESDNKSYLCEGWRMFFKHALPSLQKLIK